MANVPLQQQLDHSQQLVPARTRCHCCAVPSWCRNRRCSWIHNFHARQIGSPWHDRYGGSMDVAGGTPAFQPADDATDAVRVAVGHRGHRFAGGNCSHRNLHCFADQSWRTTVPYRPIHSDRQRSRQHCGFEIDCNWCRDVADGAVLDRSSIPTCPGDADAVVAVVDTATNGCVQPGGGVVAAAAATGGVAAAVAGYDDDDANQNRKMMTWNHLRIHWHCFRYRPDRRYLPRWNHHCSCRCCCWPVEHSAVAAESELGPALAIWSFECRLVPYPDAGCYCGAGRHQHLRPPIHDPRPIWTTVRDRPAVTVR